MLCSPKIACTGNFSKSRSSTIALPPHRSSLGSCGATSNTTPCGSNEPGSRSGSARDLSTRSRTGSPLCCRHRMRRQFLMAWQPLPPAHGRRPRTRPPTQRVARRRAYPSHVQQLPARRSTTNRSEPHLLNGMCSMRQASGYGQFTPTKRAGATATSRTAVFNRVGRLMFRDDLAHDRPARDRPVHECAQAQRRTTLATFSRTRSPSAKVTARWNLPRHQKPRHPPGSSGEPQSLDARAVSPGPCGRLKRIG